MSSRSKSPLLFRRLGVAVLSEREGGLERRLPGVIPIVPGSQAALATGVDLLVRDNLSLACLCIPNEID